MRNQQAHTRSPAALIFRLPSPMVHIHLHSEPVDLAGNVSVNSNTDAVIVDTTAPDITLVRTAGADNAASTAGRKYIAAPADANGLANSNIQYKNISSSTTCNSTVTGLTTYSGEVTATTGNYCFKVTDKAGNISYALQTTCDTGSRQPGI